MFTQTFKRLVWSGYRKSSPCMNLLTTRRVDYLDLSITCALLAAFSSISEVPLYCNDIQAPSLNNANKFDGKYLVLIFS